MGHGQFTSNHIHNESEPFSLSAVQTDRNLSISGRPSGVPLPSMLEFDCLCLVQATQVRTLLSETEVCKAVIYPEVITLQLFSPFADLRLFLLPL